MRLSGAPLARTAFVRILAALALVAIVAPLGSAWMVGVGILSAALVAASLGAELEPVQQRIRELDSEPSSPPASLQELARRVDRARERLAEALRRAEHERDDVLGILEATSEGILVLGHTHRIEMLNDAARRLLEPPVDPLGRSLAEVCRDRRLLAFADDLRRGAGAGSRTIELPGGPDGRRTLSVSGALVHGDRLRRRAVLVLHDMTEVSRLESVRTDFVANVTHEMRSPLASILGYAETLAEEADIAPGERADFLERIVRNSRRLDDIIRDLIELSRLEHATAPEVALTDAAGLLAEVSSSFADQARDRGVYLTFSAESLPPRIEIDEGLVRQAVVNLVDNAVKYTPAGGRVEVVAEVIGDESDRRLVIAVVDTGPGIPREHLARIFERFYRVDTARSRSLGGTGLGLAIVKHAAALHGGAVELESDEAGSTFRLVLPLPASIDARARAVEGGGPPDPLAAGEAS